MVTSCTVVPSDVRMLSLTHNATHIVAMWLEPLSPNGVVSYNVTLTSTDLLTGDLSMLEAGQVVTETQYVVEVMVEFYTEYNVSVVPFTEAGSGTSSAFSLTIPEGGTYYTTTARNQTARA